MLQAGDKSGLLGISLGERGCLVAEVKSAAGGAPQARIAEFSYPTEIALADAEAFGKALATFLDWHGITIRRVVFGVPSKWLICKPYDMPPTDAETAANVLWLHATEIVPAELGEMIFDYAGETSPTESTRLLLLGLQKRWMERLAVIAKAARLKIMAVRPCGTAIGAATAPHVNHGMILSLFPEHAELISQEGGRIRSLRHLGPVSNLAPLLAELRRATAVSSADGGSLVLWDELGLDAKSMEALRGSVPMPVVEARPHWVDVEYVTPGSVHKGLTAIALTWTERFGKRQSADFLHPRLSPPRAQRLRGPRFWLSAAAAAIVLLGIACLGDLASLQHEIASADDQLQKLAPAVERAQRFVANTEFARSFQSRNPRYLACIRDLTVALSQDNQTYFNSFNLRTDMTGEVIGRSSAEQNVVNLIDKLGAGGQFT
ncbi:MAG TPA: hypothetical protein VL992_00550, partial [Tepidisphaeraceae bacterium]|nr:hypothetical protein [Tepidisphaeraceae bacterium]